MTRSEPESESGQRRRRVLWFVFIYCASAAIFAALTYGLRAIIPH